MFSSLAGYTQSKTFQFPETRSHDNPIRTAPIPTDEHSTAESRIADTRFFSCGVRDVHVGTKPCSGLDSELQSGHPGIVVGSLLSLPRSRRRRSQGGLET